MDVDDSGMARVLQDEGGVVVERRCLTMAERLDW